MYITETEIIYVVILTTYMKYVIFSDAFDSCRWLRKYVIFSDAFDSCLYCGAVYFIDMMYLC